MAEQSPTPVFKVTDKIMKNHLITFLFQYISTIQHIEDKRQLVYQFMYTWQKKFNESVDIVKETTAKHYAEKLDEDEDVWDVILDINSTHIPDDVKEFADRITESILQNMKLV